VTAFRFTIVGQGRLGRGLAAAVQGAKGMEIRLTAGRRPVARMLRGADAILLAVPDPALDEVAEAVRPAAVDAVLLHASGARPARDGLGAMHPLASFADPTRPPSLEGCLFLIDGGPLAVAAATRIAKAAGGRPLVAPLHGPAYHAAAAMTANGAAALTAVGARVFEGLGIPKGEAARVLGALLRTVATNVEQVGFPQALSGPVLRGDVDTVRAHRRALAKVDREGRDAYDAIVPAIVALARRGDLSEAKARAILGLLLEG
jgi:predicted short-subunit dehydrogenase-like oxidoreductase (DUF2520 family)